MVRQGPKPSSRPAVKRLGKIRGAILDVLAAAGGTATLQEIAAALHRKRARDLRRRNLPMLQDERILTVDGDVVTLAPNWLDALDEARELGGEIGAEEIARRRLQTKRKAYHGRYKVEASHHYANVSADGWTEDLQPDGPEASADRGQEVSVSPLAAAIRSYLEKNPNDACQPPGWIGVTLWAHNLYPGKPTPAETGTAIGELGGEKYLRMHLERAREAA